MSLTNKEKNIANIMMLLGRLTDGNGNSLPIEWRTWRYFRELTEDEQRTKITDFKAQYKAELLEIKNKTVSEIEEINGEE